jgi:hypothetical protein
MQDFIELQIISAVRELLTGKVNELLGNVGFNIPFIEFSDYQGRDVVVPVISLSSCERTDKERLILVDAYSLTIIFTVPETVETDLNCYAYAAAVGKAFELSPTLGGIADRAVITGKKYIQPLKSRGGDDWEVVISLRVTVENQHPCRQEKI